MRITNNIMEIVEEKEQHEKNFNRCLDVLICPKCGNHLEKEDIAGVKNSTMPSKRKYTCPNCHFTHTNHKTL